MLSHGENRGFEVWIEGMDDSVRLNEYRIMTYAAQHGRPSCTSCYLETIEKPFRIMFRRDQEVKDVTNLMCQFLIDGVEHSQKVWRKEWHFLAREKTLEKVNRSIVRKPLHFAPPPSSEDLLEPTLRPPERNVVVLLRRGRWTFEGKALESTIFIHQEMVNGTGKGSDYTLATYWEGSQAMSIINPSPFVPHEQGEVVYRFEFWYRSRSELIQAGIIGEPQPHHEPPFTGVGQKRKATSELADVFGEGTSSQLGDKDNSQQLRYRYPNEILSVDKKAAQHQ